MDEATILAWLKQPGERVTRGEPLVEVETDKATIVYEAEMSGVLHEVLVDAGVSAALGESIALISVDGDGALPPTSEEQVAASSTASTPSTLPLRLSGPISSSILGRVRATPVARRLALEFGVSLQSLEGSGPGGRIVRADVRRCADSSAAAESGRGVLTSVPHSATQRTIAERMARSRAEIPEFTIETEISMEAAACLREDLRAGGAEKPPSYNDFVVRATALALRDFPSLNATYETGKTVLFGRVNVGVAVATDDALLVPTIKDADKKSIFEIASETKRLVEAARRRSLTTEDLSDGTFTVSNLGMFGIRRFTAVINAPQAAILAVGEVSQRAAVAGGVVVVRLAADFSLSCDHRVVYGAEAARFLSRIRELIEHPTLLVVGAGMSGRDG
jgi:pyruvate dehydrogenase E2 component (dihydrolipoamide acetyltransferase)